MVCTCGSVVLSRTFYIHLPAVGQCEVIRVFSLGQLLGRDAKGRLWLVPNDTSVTLLAGEGDYVPPVGAA